MKRWQYWLKMASRLQGQLHLKARPAVRCLVWTDKLKGAVSRRENRRTRRRSPLRAEAASTPSALQMEDFKESTKQGTRLQVEL